MCHLVHYGKENVLSCRYISQLSLSLGFETPKHNHLTFIAKQL